MDFRMFSGIDINDFIQQANFHKQQPQQSYDSNNPYAKIEICEECIWKSDCTVKHSLVQNKMGAMSQGATMEQIQFECTSYKKKKESKED